MTQGKAGFATRARACIAGYRDGKRGLVALDETTGRARSSYLATMSAATSAEVNGVIARLLPSIEQAECDLRMLRGVYAAALDALPDDDARHTAEQARCEALEAMRVYRSALDEIWLTVERCTRTYEQIGQTYLRHAKVKPSALGAFDASGQLNGYEGRYATYERLVGDGYFDRHYE